MPGRRFVKSKGPKIGKRPYGKAQPISMKILGGGGGVKKTRFLKSYFYGNRHEKRMNRFAEKNCSCKLRWVSTGPWCTKAWRRN